jgi:ferredoxin-NADP reductase
LTEDRTRFPLTLRVQEASFVAERVLALALVDPSGALLPHWTPGAHIDLVLPSGAMRSYSLYGDADRKAYRIAVLHEKDGRGGSSEIHQRQLVGSLLKASAPRNQFELVEAPHYLFIAGGIGVTPLLAMVREVAARRGAWDMFYLGRHRAGMGFLETLAGCANESGGLLDVVSRDERERVSVADMLAHARPDSAIYCCGPDGLLADVEAACQIQGRTLHLERFGRPVLKPNVAVAVAQFPVALDSMAPCDPDGPFQVELKRTGVTLDIGPEESILDRARTVRSGLTFSCSEGYCGTCETRVILGTPDHRDTVLTDEEKDANATMMICVGRSRTKLLVLDL